MTNEIFHKRIMWPLAFTVVLLWLRMVYSGQLTYVFLASNLVLAWIPFAVSQVLVTKNYLQVWKQLCLFFTWLFMLPNAPYIITDLIHLKERAPVPYWIDIILVFSAAFNGLMLGFLSIRNVDRFLSARFVPKTSNRILIASFFLCGFGVYLGRFMRWYSWDIFLNAPEVGADIMHRFVYPWEHPRTWIITILFGFFQSFTYFSMKSYKQQ